MVKLAVTDQRLISIPTIVMFKMTREMRQWIRKSVITQYEAMANANWFSLNNGFFTLVDKIVSQNDCNTFSKLLANAMLLIPKMPRRRLVAAAAARVKARKSRTMRATRQPSR